MIDTLGLFAVETILAGGDGTSEVINLSDLPKDSSLWLDVDVSGDGTVDGAYLLGNSDDDTFYTPSGISTIFTGHTKVTGDSGRDLYQLSGTYLSPRMKIKFTEVGSANSIITTTSLIVWGGKK